MGQPGGHLGDGEGRGVGREDALPSDDRLDLRKDLLLDGQLLEDRLDDEVRPGEAVLARGARDQSLEAARRVGADPALVERLVDLAVDDDLLGEDPRGSMSGRPEATRQ
jgi:hypothetical protein